MKLQITIFILISAALISGCVGQTPTGTNNSVNAQNEITELIMNKYTQLSDAPGIGFAIYYPKNWNVFFSWMGTNDTMEYYKYLDRTLKPGFAMITVPLTFSAPDANKGVKISIWGNLSKTLDEEEARIRNHTSNSDSNISIIEIKRIDVNGIDALYSHTISRNVMNKTQEIAEMIMFNTIVKNVVVDEVTSAVESKSIALEYVIYYISSPGGFNETEAMAIFNSFAISPQ